MCDICLWYRFFADFYTRLEPYFAADPLLLYDFVYLCPESDFKELFGNVPTHMSLTRLLSQRPLPFIFKDVRI